MTRLSSSKLNYATNKTNHLITVEVNFATDGYEFLSSDFEFLFQLLYMVVQSLVSFYFISIGEGKIGNL